MEIIVIIKKDGETIDSDKVFHDYNDAIQYLNAQWSKEMDEEDSLKN